MVLIHAVNPYGFDSLRRNNEHNVDLNRNFLMSDEDYHGAPDGYENLNGFLNPPSPSSSFEPFRLKVLWKIWRMGLPALKNSIAGGQYEFPRGLFFGGHGREQSTLIIQDHIERWIVGASDIVHIDFHSGLGQYGEYKLLLVEPQNSSEIEWYRDTFGAEYVEPLANAEGTAYTASGIMGNWIAGKLRGRNYRFVGAEFGTYSIIRVLAALRAENRVHFFCSSSDARYKSAKAELLECFCPASNQWREAVLERGLSLIEQAIGSNS
ncbi:MAG: M14 family metallopeptidase [Xenococcus sp. MO_188.B8]|nr:M14 family metallopeptidase [Xenococcus sp. MO_188.B8]